MTLSKSEFIDVLIGFVEGDEACVKVMEAAYTKKQPIWAKDEWIYVKDIEMSLKGIYKIYKRGDFENFRSVRDYILSSEDQTALVSDSWARDRLRDCRVSLENISLPS